jgi:uncharacterized Zn-finger protein
MLQTLGRARRDARRSQDHTREHFMAHDTIPHFQNSAGHPTIRIGAKEFMCVGAAPPHDHPHVFLDMGDDSERVCPYCSTLYVYDASLKPDETVPAGCVFHEAAA